MPASPPSHAPLLGPPFASLMLVDPARPCGQVCRRPTRPLLPCLVLGASSPSSEFACLASSLSTPCFSFLTSHVPSPLSLTGAPTLILRRCCRDPLPWTYPFLVCARVAVSRVVGGPRRLPMLFLQGLQPFLAYFALASTKDEHCCCLLDSHACTTSMLTRSPRVASRPCQAQPLA